MKSWVKGMLAAAGAVLLLSGCAGPRYAEVASRIPAMEAGAGRIYFYQLASSAGADAAQPPILVDGRKVGRSKPGRFFFVDRPAGRLSVAIAAARKDPADVVEVTLPAGQAVYLRVDITDGRQALRQETSAEVATQSMADLKYWGAGWRDRKNLRY
ncbi:DUF2846 domain-containing protein [Achromobacter agilis]|uniref:DUF2846 domain-containing protein n=1 Tax=Achromobacter agilis TaxID=1353888 RepID=A0A446CTI4_9BURK|nr:DUF2846 domain-containing protein [Achromobacter agilis]SSW71142.1 hypothetical protein AGI3411_04970 [Achromobacter agilis]